MSLRRVSRAGPNFVVRRTIQIVRSKVNMIKTSVSFKPSVDSTGYCTLFFVNVNTSFVILKFYQIARPEMFLTIGSKLFGKRCSALA